MTANLRGTLENVSSSEDGRTHVVSDLYNALVGSHSHADSSRVIRGGSTDAGPLSGMPPASAPPSTDVPANVPQSIDGYAQAFSVGMGAPSRPVMGSAPPITLSEQTNTEGPGPPAEPSPGRPRQRPATVVMSNTSSDTGDINVEQSLRDIRDIINDNIDELC